MDFFTYRISLDMNESTSQSFLNVRKSDSARKLLFTLSDNGKAYQIGSGCTAVFRAKKPDGTILYNNCSINGNAIEYEITNQTISAEGIVECEVTLYGDDGRQITSPRFNIVVNDTIYADGEVESQNEFTQLTQAILGANNLNIDVERSGEGTVITITKKDGTSEQVIVSKVFSLNVFVITETEVVTNKTYAEIKAAIDAGDIIYITDKDGVVYMPQVAKTGTKIEFLWLDSHEDRTYRWSAVVNSENAWSVTIPELVNTDRLVADLSEKVDKVTGKGLSTNDYTVADKAKVEMISKLSGNIGDLNDLTTEAKNNLVAAINEAAQTGGSSASIAMRVDGGYIQYSTDNGKTWVNLIAEADLKGAKGDKGDKGADGAPGENGDKGDAFTYSDFTTEQLAALKGEKGDTGAQGPKGDTGAQGPQGDTGAKGDHGAPGKDGHSPVVTATKSGKTTTISVDGTAIATVEDGTDGAPGVAGTPGKDGVDGHTPVKGTDYWTAADKQEIVNNVLAALPDGTEVSY